MVFSRYLVGLSIRSPFLHTCIVHKACPLRETAIGPRITYLPGRPSCNDGALGERLELFYGADLADRLLSFAPPAGSEAGLAFLAIVSIQWLFQMNSDGTG